MTHDLRLDAALELIKDLERQVKSLKHQIAQMQSEHDAQMRTLLLDREDQDDAEWVDSVM